MTHISQLEAAVNLGYGDLINIAFEQEADGQPAWAASNHDQHAKWLHSTALEFRAAGIQTDSPAYLPALYVCANSRPQDQEPLTSLYAGPVLWNKDPDEFWEPSLYIFGYAGTLRAVAVRVLGTLASTTMHELLERDIQPLADDNPKAYAIARSILDEAIPQRREPSVHTIPTDLSLAENPALYLVR